MKIWSFGGVYRELTSQIWKDLHPSGSGGLGWLWEDTGTSTVLAPSRGFSNQKLLHGSGKKRNIKEVQFSPISACVTSGYTRWEAAYIGLNCEIAAVGEPAPVGRLLGQQEGARLCPPSFAASPTADGTCLALGVTGPARPWDPTHTECPMHGTQALRTRGLDRDLLSRECCSSWSSGHASWRREKGPRWQWGAGVG